EDGIRDLTVTGVQTCALPIYDRHRAAAVLHGRWRREHDADLLMHLTKPPSRHRRAASYRRRHQNRPASVSRKLAALPRSVSLARSEERRVGKECRWRWSQAAG